MQRYAVFSFSASIYQNLTCLVIRFYSTYYYRSYAKTSSSTIYGEERSFVTGNGSTGIDNMEFGVSTSTITGYYDLGGRKFNNLQKGLNIIRYSDGSVRKVMLK